MTSVKFLQTSEEHDASMEGLTREAELISTLNPYPANVENRASS